ncbi:hypothetical protein BDW59DRAFT_64409 [Aspergillus cavernicola]|uniref:Uncharacterized protein n=1 Tax=Aspergillus cavernicola TaxID=176166 RepID=A0ABR4J195_9EURO
MRTSPQPASVFDVDERDNPILHSKRTATRVTKRHSDPGSRGSKHETKPKPTQKPALIIGKSRYHGSINHVVTTYCGDSPLTIFSTGKDDSEERNGIEGACFRKIFLTDETEILNPSATYERQRYVKLVILISHTDEIYKNPTIFVEQQTYQDGNEQTMVHELIFGTVVQLGREYVFPGCGDVDQLLGKRDLFVRFHSLDETVFSEYINRARYYGYDQHDCVRVDKQMLSTGVDYTASPLALVPGVSPLTGYLEGSDLQALLTAKENLPQADGYLFHDGIELLKLRFRKFGRWSKDQSYGGDLILHFVYSP